MESNSEVLSQELLQNKLCELYQNQKTYLTDLVWRNDLIKSINNLKSEKTKKTRSLSSLEQQKREAGSFDEQQYLQQKEHLLQSKQSVEESLQSEYETKKKSIENEAQSSEMSARADSEKFLSSIDSDKYPSPETEFEKDAASFYIQNLDLKKLINLKQDTSHEKIDEINTEISTIEKNQEKEVLECKKYFTPEIEQQQQIIKKIRESFQPDFDKLNCELEEQDQKLEQAQQKLDQSIEIIEEDRDLKLENYERKISSLHKEYPNAATARRNQIKSIMNNYDNQRINIRNKAESEISKKKAIYRKTESQVNIKKEEIEKKIEKIRYSLNARISPNQKTINQLKKQMEKQICAIREKEAPTLQKLRQTVQDLVQKKDVEIDELKQKQEELLRFYFKKHEREVNKYLLEESESTAPFYRLYEKREEIHELMEFVSKGLLNRIKVQMETTARNCAENYSFSELQKIASKDYLSQRVIYFSTLQYLSVLFLGLLILMFFVNLPKTAIFDVVILVGGVLLYLIIRYTRKTKSLYLADYLAHHAFDLDCIAAQMYSLARDKALKQFIDTGKKFSQLSLIQLENQEKLSQTLSEIKQKQKENLERIKNEYESSLNNQMAPILESLKQLEMTKQQAELLHNNEKNKLLDDIGRAKQDLQMMEIQLIESQDDLEDLENRVRYYRERFQNADDLTNQYMIGVKKKQILPVVIPNPFYIISDQTVTRDDSITYFSEFAHDYKTNVILYDQRDSGITVNFLYRFLTQMISSLRIPTSSEILHQYIVDLEANAEQFRNEMFVRMNATAVGNNDFKDMIKKISSEWGSLMNELGKVNVPYHNLEEFNRYKISHRSRIRNYNIVHIIVPANDLSKTRSLNDSDLKNMILNTSENDNTIFNIFISRDVWNNPENDDEFVNNIKRSKGMNETVYFLDTEKNILTQYTDSYEYFEE